jgi:hypothetical protein
MYYMNNALLRYNQLDVASYLMENAISSSLMKFKAPQKKLKKTKAYANKQKNYRKQTVINK